MTIGRHDSIKPTGWICPKCQAVMSPSTTACIYCKPNSNTNICCASCNGKGYFTTGNICRACSGSGRWGFDTSISQVVINSRNFLSCVNCGEFREFENEATHICYRAE